MANKNVTFTKEQKDHLINLFTDLRKMNQTMLSELTERVENADGFSAEDNDLLLQEEAIDSTFTLVMDNIKKLSVKKPEHMEICVYVHGGNVQGAIGTHKIAVDVFDVDNLSEDNTPDEIQARWETLKKSHPINVL